MTHNDILRRLRYALNLTDAETAALITQGGGTTCADDIAAQLSDDSDTPAQLREFLDGLILARRGPPREGTPTRQATEALTHNEVLKKLRVALILREPDLREILDSVGQSMSKSELSALFRKPSHKHYRECGDQVMRKFLRGLTQRLRSS